MLEIEIIEVSVTQMGFALMLKPPNREKVVPIFIGPLETYSISSSLERQKLDRPLTHDLMKEILSSLNFHVARIVVDDFKSGTFFSKLYIENKKGQGVEIDSRPSDAIAMAIRFNAPIFMTEEVYDATAIHIDQVKDKIDRLLARDEVDTLNSSPNSGEKKRTGDILQSLLNDFGDVPSEQTSKTHSPQNSDKGKAFQSKAEVLGEMLKVAIKRENYEEAAKIRDELDSKNEIKKGKKPKKKRSKPLG